MAANNSNSDVVVLTGAGGGIGRATAVRLGGHGVRLALTDVNESALRETADQVAEAGPEPVVEAGDGLDPSVPTALAARAAETFGRIDGLVNATGITLPTSLRDTTPEDFDRVMSVNVKTHLLMMQAVLPVMAKARYGSIVNISSVGARVALPNLGVYCASKSAVLGLSRSVAAEYAPDNIRCNAICPGGVDTALGQAALDPFEDKQHGLEVLTGRQLFKRWADPDEIASLVEYLLARDSAFVTGAVFDIDGGHTTT
ncbi:SDR family NAD(P)-dependent oxidoreductase [Amycolatopsis halotolerans]|uniref:SDR family NAD(P)-dependent oxidoreductase n=1 Tax=Amycolatopsis halotolerans TaxID=330083 RepID=A0ABV7Q979_9PSEU